ncbi:STAS domain-containing protein [Polyangium aurulentum]|uniref:STAS domain-containing protein n=1 Tax=Polyangium aurulentum TaxID=2567896 RepID=UPI0010AED6B2|nr:STAS domain-containing protein [Polyangium aurulentum]UQA55976.1 STAS domain-containing protein [Polyangium aurulentum]
MSSADPQIEIDGVSFTWNRARGLFFVNGMPAAALLIESTLAGLMRGVQQMVGLERFQVAIQAAGRESIEGEWDAFVSRAPTVREGLEITGQLTPLGGLGRWEIVDFDEATKTARFRVHDGWEELYQRALGVSWGSSFVAGKFAGFCTRAFGTYCTAEQTASAARGDAYDEFAVSPSPRTLEERLAELVREEKATSADLSAALGQLRSEMDERRRVEEELVRKLEVIQQKEEEIRSLSTPILRIWRGVLALPVIGRVDGVRASQMMENLLSAIVDTGATFTILDLTGVGAVDHEAVDHMLRLVRAASLLGTRCLISGVSPRMAQIVVELGLNLSELVTFGTLEAALQYAIDRTAPSRRS